MAEVTEGFEGFVEIVSRGSLTAAATAMGLPRSTLSRQLSRLEERMGVRLIHRSTRRLVPTRAGEELFARARRIVDDTRTAVEAVRRHDDVPRGSLRVTAPPVYDTYLAQPVLSFVRAHPLVALQLDTTSRLVDLVAEGFDVALRGGLGAPPDHVRRVLFRTDIVAVASPGYLARAGRPERPEDLDEHELVIGFDASHMAEKVWPLRSGSTIRVSGSIVTNDLVLRRTAAEEGLGIALLPISSARSALCAGTLEHVLPEVLGLASSLAIVYPHRAMLAPQVRAFVDHMISWADALPAEPWRVCPATGALKREGRPEAARTAPGTGS